MLAKKYHLKASSQFQQVFKTGAKYVSAWFIIYYQADATLENFQVGTVISKKFGGAVERNHTKRLIHEALFLYNKIKTIPKIRIIIIPRQPIKNLTLQDLQEKIAQILPAITKEQQ